MSPYFSKIVLEYGGIIQKLTTIVEQQILQLHDKKLTNRQIAKQLNINHKTVAIYLQKFGRFTNGTVPCTLQIRGFKGKCTVCNKWKLLAQFKINWKGTSREYRLSTCNICLNERRIAKLNNNLIYFLKDKYSHVKTSAKRRHIPFLLSFEDFISIFKKQQGKCFYTQVSFAMDVNKGIRKNTLSLDRIYNNKGYSKKMLLWLLHLQIL